MMFGPRQSQQSEIDRSSDQLCCNKEPFKDSSLGRVGALNATMAQLHSNYAGRAVLSGVDQSSRQQKYLTAILSSLLSSLTPVQTESQESLKLFLSKFASDDLSSESLDECDPRLSAEADLLLQLERQASAIATDMLQGLDHGTCLSRAQVQAVTRNTARMFEPATQKLAAAALQSAAYGPRMHQVSPRGSVFAEPSSLLASHTCAPA